MGRLQTAIAPVEFGRPLYSGWLNDMTKRSFPAETLASHNRALDLDRYTVAYLVWIANKLSRGASHNYLKVFGVGVEIWRCLVLLAIHESIAAQQVSQVMGMDKASVSRCFKTMQSKGLIMMSLDPSDGRVRIATLTQKGRALHDQILDMALERERALLSVLNGSERDTLLGLLKRVHENLRAVEVATSSYIAKRYPRARASERTRSRGIPRDGIARGKSARK